MASLTNFSRIFFISSLANSSGDIVANLVAVMAPDIKLERRPGFLTSFKLATRDLIRFLYLVSVFLIPKEKTFEIIIFEIDLNLIQINTYFKFSKNAVLQFLG